MANIINVNAIVLANQFNPAASPTRHIGVSQIVEVFDTTVAGQPVIKSAIKTLTGKIYSSDTAATIVSAANA